MPIPQIRRTKIVATLGPASSDVETLTHLFEAGVDVCRINFSHGDYSAVEEIVKNIRYIKGDGIRLGWLFSRQPILLPYGSMRRDK